MSKTVKIVVALALALAVAAPAMAETKLSGYYRLQGIAESFNRTPDSVQDTASYIDNRIRFKMDHGINDFISVTYYMEVDTPWGTQSKGNIGNGGKISADGVNVETKNAYVTFKVPDTTWTIRTGIQGWGTGNAYESLVVDDDMSGISLAGDAGPVKLNLIYSKWDEGANSTTSATSWDDTDFYGALATIKATEQLSLGAFLGWKDLNNTQQDDVYVGLNGDFRFSDFGITGFFLYKDLSSDTAGANLEGSAMAFDLKGNAKLGFGDMKLHFAYFSEDDDANDKNTFDAAPGVFEYHNDNLMLFLTDVYYNNGQQGALALKDAAYQGYGLMFFTVSGNIKLPAAYYAKYGVGYFAAVDDKRNNEAVASRSDTDLGIEVAAQVGKKFAEKYDVSLRGAYGVLGDFYSGPAGTSDPDDIYKVVAQLNVGF